MVILGVQGRWIEALAECDDVLLKQPTYVDALINKGSVLVKLGEPVRAIEVLSEAVKLAPDNPLARTNLATALRHVGELESAREQIDSAIELNPNGAIESDPNNPRSWRMTVTVYALHGCRGMTNMFSLGKLTISEFAWLIFVFGKTSKSE